VLAAQLEKIVANNRKINALTLDQYKAGARSFADVLTAQRAVLQAENSLTVTKTALLTGWVDLQRALGGGWNGELNVRPPENPDEDNVKARLAVAHLLYRRVNSGLFGLRLYEPGSSTACHNGGGARSY
jgi:hypothetical protein